MEVLVVVFRSKGKPDLFHKLEEDIVGNPYNHVAMVIDDMFCELRPTKGEDYVMIPFINKENIANLFPHYIQEYYKVPKDFSQNDIWALRLWWEKNRTLHNSYGVLRFFTMAFFRFFNWLSSVYYDKTGKILEYNKLAIEKNQRVCSSSVDECLCSIGIDLFPNRDVTYTIPVDFVNKLKDYKC